MSIDKIIDTVCIVFNISKDDLLSSSRKAVVADARCIAIEIIMSNELCYIDDVCALFNRKKTTIIASRNKFKSIYKYDKLFTSKYDEIIAELNSSMQNINRDYTYCSISTECHRHNECVRHINNLPYHIPLGSLVLDNKTGYDFTNCEFFELKTK